MQHERPRRAQPAEDVSDLLRTKLAPPRPRPALVAREPLLARLHAGLERKLTLLSAPAGFGKTTLVSAWMAARLARHDLPPIGWVSLDAGDNDPVRFWRYLITACQEFDPTLGKSALALLQAPHQPIERALTALLNDVLRLSQVGVLILEDYQVITAPQIHESLAFLLDHLPATLRVLVMSRAEPPLPLARWRAHNDLSELDAADLRFSAQESQAFLEQALGQPLSAESLARLEARTECWAAGLHLVALALQGRGSPQEMELVLLNFTGSHRHIMEYVLGEVFAAQPEAVQGFLLQTAALRRLTGSLCDALTGKADGQEMLDYLERANLFLIALDETGEWYRYHALFAEALQHEARRRLGEDALHRTSQQASVWYEQHGLLAEAIEAAFAAQHFERAADLIEGFNIKHRFHNELHTLQRWIEQLPPEILSQRPEICLACAWSLLYSLDRSDPATKAAVEIPLGLAERFWQAKGNRVKLGEVLALHIHVMWWQGEYARASALAHQALELLGDEATLFGTDCFLFAAAEELHEGRYENARHNISRAEVLLEAQGNFHAARAARLMLANLASKQGRPAEAAQRFRQVMQEAGDDYTDGGLALMGLAELALERNDLDAAMQQVTEALTIAKHYTEALGKHYAQGHFLGSALLLQARILHARGETSQAQREVEEVLVMLERRRWPTLEREVRAWHARLALAAGDLAAAQQWYETVAQQVDGVPLVQQEQEAGVVARLLMAQGGQVAALHLLERWQHEAHAQERPRARLEMQLLSALAHIARNDQPTGRALLIQALTQARRGDYQRLFLDEGAPMAAALRAVLPALREPALEAFTRALLAAFPQAGRALPAALAAPAALVEPLSQQERRVLRLLAAGRSNPEIASELIVSVNTVKTQVQSIFRKLHVSSRKEARAAAQALHLL